MLPTEHAALARGPIAYVCEGSKHEITHASEGDVPFSKKQILDLMDRDILEKDKALAEANWRKERFLDWFGKYFVETTPSENATV